MKYDLIAGGFVVRDKKVLLIDHKKLEQWLPFGGHIEPGESPHEALIRECKEELPGLELRFLQFPEPPFKREIEIPMNLNVHVHSMPADNTTPEPHLHYCINYLCTTKSKNFDYNRDELRGFRWFNEKDLGLEKNMPENIKEFSLYSLDLAKYLI